MKKLIYLLPILFLAGCSPQFSAGGWFVPLLTGASALYFWYKYYKLRVQWAFVFAIILTVATLLIIGTMALDL